MSEREMESALDLYFFLDSSESSAFTRAPTRTPTLTHTLSLSLSHTHTHPHPRTHTHALYLVDLQAEVERGHAPVCRPLPRAPASEAAAAIRTPPHGGQQRSHGEGLHGRAAGAQRSVRVWHGHTRASPNGNARASDLGPAPAASTAPRRLARCSSLTLAANACRDP
jgi:hypothetical protein